MQCFSQTCFKKVVTFSLIDDKKKNIQPHQISVLVVHESLRRHNLIVSNIFYRISLLNIFRKTWQIATKVCGHGQIISTDFKPEADAPLNIMVESNDTILHIKILQNLKF